MRIGILGSGMVGKQLALGFIKSGHEVKVGTRDVSKLKDWQNEAGANGSAGSFNEAAGFGELIVLATSWAGTENAISMAGKENFKGKIVIDVTNPLDFSGGSAPKIAASFGNSGGEQIQKLLPDSKVVKAFNIINAYKMANPEFEDGDADLFIAGNDNDAKKVITSIAEKWGWKSIIDIGGIEKAYWLETLTMLWIEYASITNTWSHAFKLLKK